MLRFRGKSFLNHPVLTSPEVEKEIVEEQDVGS
jgi:hypothetical protein